MDCTLELRKIWQVITNHKALFSKERLSLTPAIYNLDVEGFGPDDHQTSEK